MSGEIRQKLSSRVGLISHALPFGRLWNCARIVFDCRMANDLGMLPSTYASPRTMSEITYLKIACERCGGHTEYPSEMAGQSIQCPHCQHTITLPSRFVSLQIPLHAPTLPRSA